MGYLAKDAKWLEDFGDKILKQGKRKAQLIDEQQKLAAVARDKKDKDQRAIIREAVLSIMGEYGQ